MNRTHRAATGLRLATSVPIVLLIFCLTPRLVAADLLDDVLGVAASVGMIDADVVRSKPLIECLIGGGAAVTCAEAAANVQQEAVQMLPATDSNIKLIVALVQAVADERWLQVIELTGQNGAIIACKLLPGGSLSTFFCSGIAQEAINISKGTFEAIYGAIVEGNWWALVAVVPNAELLDAVCDELLPGEVSTVVCSGLLQAVGKLVGLLEDGVGLIVDLAEGLAEIFLGSQDAPMDASQYYRSWWRAEDLHWMVLSGLQKPGPGIDVWPSRTHRSCVTYYDNHQMSEDDAERLCQQMGDSLLAEARAYKALAFETVAAYVKGSLQPRRYAIAAAYWGNIPANDPGDAYAPHDLELECLYAVGQTFSSLPPYSSLNGHPKGITPSSVRNWVCQKALEEQFLPTLTAVKAELQNQIFAPLVPSALPGRLGLRASGGCQIDTAYNQPRLVIHCDSFEKWRTCRNIFVGLGIDVHDASQPRCEIESFAASNTLAKEIAADLGPRCTNDHMTIACTREWKVPACYDRLGEVLAGLPGTAYRPQCTFTSTPDYAAAKTKAIEILNGLNGAGRVAIGPGGQAIPDTVFSAETACYSLPDPLVLNCKGRFDIPQSVVGELTYCKSDPNNDGVDAPCFLDLPDAAQISTTPATPITTVSPTSPAASPALSQRRNRPTLPVESRAESCRYEATYYEPMPPIIESSASDFQVGDQTQLRCEYRLRTRVFEWPQCDASAKDTIRSLEQGAQSGSRYSGLLVVDGTTVAVVSSPPDGGDFQGTHLWTFHEPGDHDVACRVDNGLRPAEHDGLIYLESSAVVSAGAASGGGRFRRFEPDTAQRLPTNANGEQDPRRITRP